MATKFTLIPNPTFSKPVTIPRAGDDDGELIITFKNKRRSDLESLEKALNEKLVAMREDKKFTNEPTADYLMEICQGWELPEEFNRDNLITLLENYPRAFDAIAQEYTREMMAIREKN